MIDQVAVHPCWTVAEGITGIGIETGNVTVIRIAIGIIIAGIAMIEIDLDRDKVKEVSINGNISHS